MKKKFIEINEKNNFIEKRKRYELLPTFIQEDGEPNNGLDYSDTGKDGRKNTIETYSQNEVVNDKDVNSTDDLHQNNSQSLADKLDKNPANQEAPEKKIQNVCHSS